MEPQIHSSQRRASIAGLGSETPQINCTQKQRHGVFDVDPTLPYFEGSHPGSHIFWSTMPLVQYWSDMSWDGVLALVYRGEILFDF